MQWYLDSSALLKFYREEDGTENVYRLFESSGPAGDLVTSLYTSVEVASAAQRLINAGLMKEATKKKLLSKIMNPDYIELFPLRYDCLHNAVELIGTHNLRGGDSIQLSSALEYRSANFGDFAFVCSDSRLNNAARKEGLNVYDPSQSDLDEWLKSL